MIAIKFIWAVVAVVFLFGLAVVAADTITDVIDSKLHLFPTERNRISFAVCMLLVASQLTIIILIFFWREP